MIELNLPQGVFHKGINSIIYPAGFYPEIRRGIKVDLVGDDGNKIGKAKIIKVGKVDYAYVTDEELNLYHIQNVAINYHLLHTYGDVFLFSVTIVLILFEVN